MRQQTKGYCKYCGKEYTRGGMLRHLPACKSRKARLEEEGGQTACGYFEVSVTGKYNNDYWLILEISENATLMDLDKFIRDIWVECCGHLSAFDIGGVSYEAYPDEDDFWGPPAKSLNYKLKKVFSVGQTIGYEYDFGSTTELVLKVHSYRVGKSKRGKITILSRNNPIEWVCSQCGKNKAVWIDPLKYYDEDTFWCEECMRKRREDDGEFEDGEEADDSDRFDEDEMEDILEGILEHFLPVCNSPRMGVCGYEGSSKYPDQFVPDVGGKDVPEPEKGK